MTLQASHLRTLQSHALPRRDVDVGLLRTLLAVVETGSLQRASEGMCRSQAAVSQQLKRLEELTEASVFEKQGRRLALTPTGERLVSYARNFLDVHDDLAASLSGHQAGLQISRAYAGSDSFVGSLAGTDAINGQLMGALRELGDPVANHGSQQIKTFEDNLRSRQHRSILKRWKENRALGRSTTLDDLAKAGLIVKESDVGLLFAVESSQIRCIDATGSEARDFGFDKHGYDAPDERMIENQAVLGQRRNMYFACLAADVPVFYTGNAIMPSDSPVVAADPTYMTRGLDRLLLPVDLTGRSGASAGLLIIGVWDQRRSYGWLQSGGSHAPNEVSQMNVTESVVFGF